MLFSEIPTKKYNPIVKHDAVICEHKITGCIFNFTQHVNPKNTNDYFLRWDQDRFNGKAETLDTLKNTFEILTINLWVK